MTAAEFPTLVQVLRQHRVKVSHGRYWVAQCSGCEWTIDAPVGFRATALDAHEAHQAAAWREACTLRTAEQLEALPPETVIKTEGGSIACRHYTGVGVVFGDDRPFPWTSSLVTELPGVVMWHPNWADQ